VLTHVVLITVPDDAPEGAVDDLVADLRALPAQIPEIHAYTVGVDLGLAEGNANVAVVGRYASPEDLRTYIDHPAHQAVVRDRIRAIGASTVRAQIAEDPPAA
jgi:Stress responsive A/B Barrel Domain